ncbi:hypothetical protein SteCoe_35373 [Stentor coeruleus]|uniref:Protein kinase domain-containing protein n=1 Tax=Stentor coeruleus TaxID=5963 RepID=A0A1R2ANH2_9CILI|nr:hypothetical protein SteCoe_37260 [Stentor coeruleus]OMJ67467.1 hypothetical protein SteCoe_35373 [Stentor coeruleus]
MKSIEGEHLRFPKYFIKVSEALLHNEKECYYQAHDSDNKVYLLKIFQTPSQSVNFQEELQGAKLVGLHGKLLMYLDNIELQEYSGILYEYAARVTLTSALRSTSLNDSQIITILRDILLALYHLHSRKLVHRQITKDSIFVTHNFKFKLGDYAGVCHEYELKSLSPKLPQELKAPEMLEGAEEIVWTCAIDIWSLGCLLYELLYCQSAFTIEGLDNQLRGKYRKSEIQAAVYWKLVLDRLLDPNPQTRGTIQEIITLIHESYMPNMTSIEPIDSIRSGSMFKKSSNSWVKEVTIENEQIPDQIYITKLVGKAWNKPSKIPLFFQALIQRPFTKASVVLKILIVVMKYMVYGPRGVFDGQMGGTGFIEELEKYWLYSSKPKMDKINSEELIQVIRNMINLVKMKLKLHSSIATYGDWSDFRSQDNEMIHQVLAYWENNIKTTKSLLANPDQYHILRSCMTSILIQEQQKIMLEIEKSLSSCPQELIESYQENQNQTVSLLQRYKTCFPNQAVMKMFTTEPVLSKPSSNSSVKSASKSEARSAGSTKTEDRCTTNYAKRGSIFQTDSSWVINMSELELKQSIGVGSSCTVYKGIYRHTSVAIKVLRNTSQSSQKEFEREVETMVKLRHPNLVLFMGASVEKELCIVTEFCIGDTLFHLLHETTNVQISYRQQLKIAKDTAQGMAFLHSSNIIHRDLKSLNLLLEELIQSQNDRVHVKITDFGISRTIDEGILTGQMGTCHWMAPEVLASQPYGFPADVYSYGIVLWEIFARETPYRGINPAMIPYQVLHMGLRPDINKISQEPIKILIQRCWSIDASARPTFSDILEYLNKL